MKIKIDNLIILVNIISLLFLTTTLKSDVRYIEMSNNHKTMRTFYEYLNESRSFDNQGQVFSTISSVQRVLVEKGFLAPTLYNGKDSIDGKFGQATSEALSKFQMANSLQDSKGVIN